MPNWITDGFNDYIKRLPRDIAFSLVEIKPEPRTSGKTKDQLLQAEKQRILAKLPSGCRMVALDEKGEGWTTMEWVAQFKQWGNSDESIAFIIGGADGLDASLKKNSHMQLRLSSLTLPHSLARVLLAEQLYRIVSILKNHPYHRE